MQIIAKATILGTVVAVVWLAPPARPQGIASGNAAAAPRAKFSGLPFPAAFTDVAREAGLTRVLVQGHPFRKKYILEANGTGAALVDVDGDGLLDVFLVNGSSFDTVPKARQPVSSLHRNLGGGRFTDITVESGVARSGWGNGVCGGDFDNDGKPDLFVTYWGPNSLYRNQGGGVFKDVAASAGVAGPDHEWSTGCSFLDYDRDGDLDLFVASYVGFSLEKIPLPGQFPHCMFKEKPVFCGPRGLPYGSATLYRNRGDGTFEDVSVASGIRKAQGYYAFTASAADLDGDGWIDIVVACDSTPNLYFRNNRDGTFRELGVETGLAYSEHGGEQAGMGLALGDTGGDSWLDILKTNFIRDYPNLYRNSGKGFFEDVALAAGLGVNPQYVLWGVGLEDFDNDGLRDVLQVGGHVYADIETIDANEPYANPRLVYRNLGNGRFEDVSHLAGPGIAARHSSRGAAFGDFDNDGDIDVLVMNMNEPPSLLRNELKSGRHWLKVKLQGTRSSRDAIGATVTVHAGGKTQTAAVLSQSSYLSLNDQRLHFGLGETTAIGKIVVRWPSGASEEFLGARADSLALLVEGSGRASTQTLQP